jgi:hypothetical protein
VVAVLFQDIDSPLIGSVQKPRKPGGGLENQCPGIGLPPLDRDRFPADKESIPTSMDIV